MVKKLKKQLIILSLLSYVASIAPLVVAVVLNWNSYTKTPSDTIKLCLGGVIAFGLMLLKSVDKLKVPNKIVGLSVALLLCWLLDSLVKDLILLLSMALLGEILDAVFFAKSKKELKEKISIEKSSDATAGKVEEIFKKYSGRV